MRTPEPRAAPLPLVGALAIALVACGPEPPTNGEAPPEAPAEPGPGEPAEPPPPVAPTRAEDPFRGSRDQGASTPAPGDTNRVDLSFDPRLSTLVTPCEDIRFIQVMQILVNGVPVNPEDFAPGPFEGRDNRSIDDDPGTESDESAMHVDRLRGRDEPYYGGNGAGTGNASPGSSGNTDADSTLRDTPRAGAGDSRMGEATTDEVVYLFETCAFCADGQDAGCFFECILWEYRMTRADVAAGSPGTSTITGRSPSPSPGFGRAVRLWVQENNFDLPECAE